MVLHLNFSWEIMPQLDSLWTGDVSIDASFVLIGILLCVIRMRP